jgi:DNA-binding CsgD family transcriptional regulator
VTNPSNITEREGQVLSALAEHGCSKLAVRSLHIETQTVNNHVLHAMRRMHCRGQLAAVVRWDRWCQAQPLLEQLPVGLMDRVNARFALRLQKACRRAA